MKAIDSNTAEKVLAMLEDVAAGRLAIVERDDPAKVFAGNVAYMLSNGWAFEVFNDCGDWDYVDTVTTPAGDTLEVELPEYDEDADIQPATRRLFNWKPSRVIMAKVFGWHR